MANASWPRSSLLTVLSGDGCWSGCRWSATGPMACGAA